MTDDIKKEKLSSARYTPANSSEKNTTVIEGSGDKDRESVQVINHIKEITQRMMAYAIKNPAIIVSHELLEKIIPVLRKDSADFNDADEIILWSSYNDLTQLIKPATNFSLIIANQLNEELGTHNAPKQLVRSFKFWRKTTTPLSSAVEKCHRELRTIFLYLISSVVFYVLIQGYSGLLSDALNDVNHHVEKWKTQQELLLSDKLTDNEREYAKELATLIDFQVASSVQFLADLTSPLFIVFNNTKQNCTEIMSNSKTPADKSNIAACITFQKQYASSMLMILSQYILPLILGTLGATAFIVRNTLEKLQTDSYLPSANGKLSMRLCLGGLLGVISGIFMSTSSAENLAGFNINLVMVSLIMGYSVEVAFSLFDSIVARMRDWTESLKKS